MTTNSAAFETKGWPVNSPISPHIVRWPAVISSPAIHPHFEGAQLLSELFLKAPPKIEKNERERKNEDFFQMQILSSEMLLSQ